MKRARNTRGFTVAYIVVLLVALVGFASLAVDYARVQVSKTELQEAATAAARAAVVHLLDGITATQNAAVTWGGYNKANGHSVVIDPNNDVVFGTWNTGTRTFTALSGSSRSSANAVKINAHLALSRGTAVPLMFGTLVGQNTCDVNASAIAVVSGSYQCVGINSLTLSGGSSDSYFSSSSTTGYTSSPNGNASLASNGLITLSGGSQCNGSAFVGPGGSTSLTGGSSISGGTTTLSQALSYPNASAGSAATSNNNSNISSSYLDGSNNFNTGGSAVNLQGGVYYFNNFTVGSALTFNGPATIYVVGTATWNKSVTPYDSIPDNLTVYMCSSNSFTTNGNNTFMGVVYAPQSTVKIQGGGSFVGSVVGYDLTFSGGSNMYCDQSYLGGAVSLVQ